MILKWVGPFCCGLVLVVSSCKQSPSGLEPIKFDEGLLITDSNHTLSEFFYSANACEEVFPPGSKSLDSIPLGSGAAVRIVSTACYLVRVDVVDSRLDTVRTFSARFGMFFRSEAEKNRGVPAYIFWDGLDNQGHVVPGGRYLWRMEFDFGAGRKRKLRADIFLE